MTTATLVQKAEQIEEQIRDLNGAARDRLAAEFIDTLQQLRSSGSAVPRHLLSLEQGLTEEAAENQFDNMPV